MSEPTADSCFGDFLGPWLALSRLEKRCHQSATGRLARLAALRRQPFVVAAGTTFGTDEAATVWLENAALTDASIEVFACACAAGALAKCQMLDLAMNKIGDILAVSILRSCLSPSNFPFLFRVLSLRTCISVSKTPKVSLRCLKCTCTTSSCSIYTIRFYAQRLSAACVM